MRTMYYYIEISEKGELKARLQTTLTSTDKDWSRIKAQHPDKSVTLSVSSEKERTFNKLSYENQL